MTRLPDRNLLEGTKQPETTTGEFRLAMGNLRQFIADLLGTDSAEKQTAVAATFIFGFLITLKNFRIFNTSEKYMRLSAV